MTPLLVGAAYRLDGITRSMWGNAHATYGTPLAIAGLYLGVLRGARDWHLFEIWVEEREVGVILMHQQDLDQLVVERVGRMTQPRREGEP
jgi:hypothetical protein